ncbi:glyoxalase/bleomycin resistance protein/dioxygenase [Cadophora sp. DSE1049]|nr:glyoxalase/bleomycin resistance protein/dioxygenase [Cadophora sp. DSE1049]
MARTIFVNISVNDIAKSTEFYTSIGGTKNPQYSNETVSCMVFSEEIHVMIMTPEIFKGFMPPSKTLADSNKVSEVLLCLSVEKKEEVDAIINTAAKGGGKADPTKLPQMPGMYGRSFEDLDGHVWELMWMDEEAAKKETTGGGEGKGAAGVV